MGSQTSKHDTAIEACLADFSDQERTHLLELFDKIRGSQNNGSKEHTTSADDDDTIDSQHFNSYFEPLLPPTLLTCFRVTMQMHSVMHIPSEESTDSGAAGGSNIQASKSKNRRSAMTRSTSIDANSRISKYGWIMTIHRLSKTNIEEQAGLSFMLQTHDESLESFIKNVTRAVMPFWLAGEVSSWKDIPEDSTTTEFLLTRHLGPGNSGTGSDFEDIFGTHESTDDLGATTSKDKAAQDWLEAAQKRDSQGNPSTKELSRSAFVNWYQHTVEYQILFTILIQNLFLSPSTLANSETSSTPRKRIKMTTEQENKLCQKNYIAPRIKGLDVAPYFSRLLTVADFFQLRYALPTPIYNTPPPPGPSKKQGTSGSSASPDGADQISESKSTPPLRLLFSSKTSGESFSTLMQKITFQGPTLVIMKDEDGYIFGAYADQDWEQKPNFYGSDRSFLFTIQPKFRIYRPSRVNNNFQYLDYGTKTLPNGIGFGGQLRYFGLWLESDFSTGQSAAEPLCSTFQSPSLSKKQDFKLDEMEVWQVHPSTVERDEGPKRSAMDAHPDAVALLEMANRKMYSKDVRGPDVSYDSD
ncbi:hypothetical protein BGZ80_002673 [Entomortierella chlamydospora]|uniref:MTOR-associated protein MEAK7 n=1 Tax=Entomortierella chlamydospora TaxID=101097 RepID=A0A9P6T377_9FUNG|nr:hypothetical protein BGZ79_006305 [Entomortierella chlamydospora]KAG0021304.1 hypothetical protein BGZ80_002673 [Entomortierella chlamydospora]